MGKGTCGARSSSEKDLAGLKDTTGKTLLGKKLQTDSPIRKSGGSNARNNVSTCCNHSSVNKLNDRVNLKQKIDCIDIPVHETPKPNADRIVTCDATVEKDNTRRTSTRRAETRNVEDVELHGTILPNIGKEEDGRLMANLSDRERREVATEKDNDYQNLNVLVNYQDLLECISESFLCRHCNRKINSHMFSRTSSGIATRIQFDCSNCNHRCCIKPREVHKNKMTSVLKKEPQGRKNMDTYIINQQLLLALQMFGLGETAAQQISMLLCLTTARHPFGAFTKAEEKVAVYHQALTNTILDENVQKEMEFSSTDTNNGGMRKLTTTMDGAWQHRGSGKGYNSDSGHHLLIGAMTGLVLAVHVMSKACSKCGTGKDHEDLLCPKNWESSSKAMEAHSAIENVTFVFYCYNVYCKIVVIDDNSLLKKVLQ